MSGIAVCLLNPVLFFYGMESAYMPEHTFSVCQKGFFMPETDDFFRSDCQTKTIPEKTEPDLCSCV